MRFINESREISNNWFNVAALPATSQVPSAAQIILIQPMPLAPPSQKPTIVVITTMPVSRILANSIKSDKNDIFVVGIAVSTVAEWGKVEGDASASVLIKNQPTCVFQRSIHANQTGAPHADISAVNILGE